MSRFCPRRSRVLAFTLLLCGGLADLTGQAPVFSAGPALGERRASHTATVLSDGRVLIAGGLNGNTTLASALLVDPISGVVSATGSLQNARGRHTATLLKDGRVLIAGGFAVAATTTTPMASAELYDPASGQFTATGSMSSPRVSHAEALLPDGRVLICGGSGVAPPGAVTPIHVTAEIFDPASGQFTAAGNMTATRAGHTATALDSGQVLVISHGTAELYDAAANRFTRTGSAIQMRTGHTATLLRDGQVLVVGGLASNLSLTVAERYDPRTASFQSTGSLFTSRHGHTATLMPDGRVLVAGGRVMAKSPADDPRPYTTTPTPTAEIYDPVAGAFSATGSLTEARGAHSAVSTANGVWIAGGIGTIGLNSSEVFAATTLLSRRSPANPPVARATGPPVPAGAAPTAGAPRLERQFSNQDHGWSIAYPRDWRLDDRDTDYVRITSPGDPAALIGIHVALFDRERVNVNDFAAAVMAAENRRPGFKLLSRQPITLADGAAALEVVNVLGVKPAGRSRKVFVIAGHRGFVVNAETYLAAWPSFAATFDVVISSIKIAPPTWQSRMADARQLAADGFAYSIATPTGASVFHNNSRTVCYTYSVPGNWVAAPEPSAYRSPDGKAFVGFLAMRDEDLREYSGGTPAERALNGITRRYEAGLRQTLTTQIAPFVASRPGAWKWTASPIAQRDREIVLSSKYVVNLVRNVVAEITISGTADDDVLARQIIESLKTTTDRSCYWPDLERLLKTGG